MCRVTLLSLLTLAWFSHHVLAYNILAIVSLPLRSHYMAFDKFFKELAIRGHSVTVLNNYPDDNPPPNLTYVDMTQEANSGGYITPLKSYENYDTTYLHWYNYYRHFEWIPQATKVDCENFFTNEKVKEHYSKGAKYDVIFVEQFMGDCGLAYAAAVYESPIIGITSHTLLPWAYPRLGVPYDLSSDSFYFSKEGPKPSLYYKVENFLLHLFFNTIGRHYVQKIIYDVFDSHVPNKLLDIEEAARERIRMMFVYQHYSVTGSRLLAPQVLEIAGLHIAKPKSVPEDIEKFLSTATHGAVYVSFGSNLKANTMSKHKQQQFLSAFKKIPQKVIWKYENATFAEDAVYTSNWMPQLDILCHPKVIAFVTHGGMLSLSEAAHCGTPVLAVPFFGDQFSNAAAARSVGLGSVVYFDNLDADTLAKGIEELTSANMQANAKRISSEWHDRPMSAMDSAIYWTEYVARHGNSPPPLPSQRTAWYEALLLDVAGVIIALLIAIVLLVYVILKLFIVVLRMIASVFWKRKPKTE